MSKLLIDDNPIQVLPKLADAIGLNKAIVLQQLHYWLNKSENIHDGRKWVYNTYEEWRRDNFPFWSAQTIGNIFRELEDDNLITSSQINKKDWDRRKWYTINYDELSNVEKTIFERLNLVRSNDTKLDSLHITETTAETTSPDGENPLSDKQKANDFLQELNARKRQPVQVEGKKPQPKGVDWAIAGDRNVTEEDLSVTRGDTIAGRLETWKAGEKVKDIARVFSEEFGILPPEFGDKYYYSWVYSIENNIINVSGKGDILQIIRDVAIDYDGFDGIKSPKSIENAVYAKRNEIKAREPKVDIVAENLRKRKEYEEKEKEFIPNPRKRSRRNRSAK